MARSYYATKLTENIARTPEGYLICRDAVIARTGFQTYNVRDLPQEKAAALGIDVTIPHAQINLYRPAEAVFDPSTIASFEGKPVTDDHPPGFVNPENFSQYACGHTQNVRKGPEALDSGDWPLIADLLITEAGLIAKVEGGLRELSCGYDFTIDRDGDKILQIGMVGNHVAVVRKGRAGAEARINDSAELLADGTEAVPPVEALPATPTKEKRTMAKTTTNFLGRILGLGLKAFAADAEPEELAEAMKAVARDESEEEAKKEKEANDRKAADKAARDAEEAERLKKEEEERKARDSRARDCQPGESGHEKCSGGNCMAKDRRAKDRGAMDRRARLHAALDEMLGPEEEEASEEHGMDADIADLKDILNEHAKDRRGKDTEEGKGEESDVIEPVEDSADEQEEEGALMAANDSAMALLPVIEKSKDKAVQRAFDAAPLDDEFTFLKAMRPAVARSKDKAVRAAFDAALKQYTRTSNASTGGYSDFAGAAARACDSKGEPMEEPKDHNATLLAYEKACEALKGKDKGGN